MADPLAALSETGVSIWLDDLDRHRIASGGLAALVADKHVVEKATVQELERSDHPWIKEYFLGPRGRAAHQSAA